jgi:TRAP-type C4-dicarboxylate transport system permease small subunit
MSTARRWLGALPHVVITVLMAIAIVDMLIGVFLRYVMTKITAALDLAPVSFFWVEEVGEWALAWMTFIAAAIGVRRGTHFAVQMVIDRLPAALRQAILGAHCVLIAAFGGLIAWFGWYVAAGNSLSFSPGLGINLRWLYLSSVAGGTLIVLYSLATLGDVLRGKNPWAHAGPEEDAPA